MSARKTTAAMTIPAMAPLLSEDDFVVDEELGDELEEDPEDLESAMDFMGTMVEVAPETKVHWEREKLPRS